VILARDQSQEPRDYEIILPYGDSVDFTGLSVSEGEVFLPAAPSPRFRYVAYGDSITQGFWASDVTRTFPYLIGAENQWEVVNLGFAGRRATGSDGALLGQTPANVVTILMGFNDHHQNAPVAECEQNLRTTVQLFRQLQPATPLGLITPLWSNYASANAAAPLEDYREAVRRIVADGNGTPTHLIEGLDLIPADAALFTDGIHPNDRGFELLAKNLAAALRRIATI
jgi:lysophospholipase L1-like esterase